MQTAEPAPLLEAFKQGPKEVEQVLKQRSCRRAVDEVQLLGRRAAQCEPIPAAWAPRWRCCSWPRKRDVPVGDDVATRITVLPNNRNVSAETSQTDSD